MDKEPTSSIENFAAKHEKYKHIGNQVFQEYETVYKVMFSKLNVNHIKPFANVLMDRENIILKNQEELVGTLRQSLEEQMQKALHNLWKSNNVSEALISLEICKEKFEEFKGHKWNMTAKTPWEITRPIRMRFKENRLRYLQAQLNCQNKELEQVLQENEAHRQRLLYVKNERALLIEKIENFRKKMELAKPKIVELQLKMISDEEQKLEDKSTTN